MSTTHRNDSHRRKKRRSGDNRNLAKLQMLFSQLFGDGADVVSRKRKHSSSSSTLSSASRRRGHRKRSERSKRRRGQTSRYRRRAGDAKVTPVEVVTLSDDQLPPTTIDITSDDHEGTRDATMDEASQGARIKSEPMVDILSDNDEDTRDATTAEEWRRARIIKSEPPSEDSASMIDEEEVRRETARAYCLTLANAWKDVTACDLSQEAHTRLVEKYRGTGDTRGSFESPNLNRELKFHLSGADIVEDESLMEAQGLLGGLLRAAEMSVATVVECNVRSSEFAQMADVLNDLATYLARLHFDYSMKRRCRVIETLGAAAAAAAATLTREIRVGESLFSEQEEKLIKLEIERNAKEEAEMRAQQEAERIAKEEAEKKAAIEKAEMRAREKAERIAKEEAEKKAAKERAEMRAREKAERKAKEEAEKAKEEAARKAAAEEEAARKAAAEEEAARKAAAEEEAARKAAAEEEARTRIEVNENAAAAAAATATAMAVEKREQQAEVGGCSKWRVKCEKNSKQFVPTSDYPGIKRMAKIARLREGYAEVAVPITYEGTAPNTLNIYDRQLKIWWDFGKRENVDVYNPEMKDITQFLWEHWQNGANYSTLCNARSALSFIIGNELGKDNRLTKLFKGFAKDWERKNSDRNSSQKANESI